MANKSMWRNAGGGGELEDLRAAKARFVKKKDELDDIIAGEDGYLCDPGEQKTRAEAAQRELPYIDAKIQVIELNILIKAEPERSARVQQWEKELKLPTMKVKFHEWKESDGPEHKRQELKAAIARLEAEVAGRP